MTTYTARLMQESGVQGPSWSFTAEDLRSAAVAARQWSLGESGHPWDSLTLTDDDNNDAYSLQLSAHGAGRSSIQIFDSQENLAADINV